jgi:hypothetical protein
MANSRRVTLTPAEEAFLRRWMYDEVHYQEGTGPAKRLQVRHGVKPVHLAEIIAAAIPDPADQEATSRNPPGGGVPTWPWSEEGFGARLAEARAVLAERTNCA